MKIVTSELYASLYLFHWLCDSLTMSPLDCMSLFGDWLDPCGRWLLESASLALGCMSSWFTLPLECCCELSLCCFVVTGRGDFIFSCIVLKIEHMKHLIMLSNLCLLHSTVSATQHPSPASIQTLTGDHLARYSMKSTVICVSLVWIARFVYQLLQRKRRSQLRLLIASDSGL